MRTSVWCNCRSELQRKGDSFFRINILVFEKADVKINPRICLFLSEEADVSLYQKGVIFINEYAIIIEECKRYQLINNMEWRSNDTIFISRGENKSNYI